MVFPSSGEAVRLPCCLLRLRVDVVAYRMLVLHPLLAVLVLLLLCVEGWVGLCAVVVVTPTALRLEQQQHYNKAPGFLRSPLPLLF